MRVGIDARELGGRPTGVGRYLRSLLRRWPAPGDELRLYFNGPAPAEPPPSPARLAVRATGRAARGLVWQELELPRLAALDALDVFFSPAYSCPLRLDLPRVTAVHDVSFFHHPQDFAPPEAARRRRVRRRVVVRSPNHTTPRSTSPVSETRGPVRTGPRVISGRPRARRSSRRGSRRR